MKDGGMFMKKVFVFLIVLMLVCSLSACGPKVVQWNGQTEYFAHVSMVFDETDPYQYVGMVDYVFVGTVTEVVRNVPEGDGDWSVYNIHVDQNLKGELVEEIQCSKHGYMKRDGTMLLLASDYRKDSGLPEAGKQYVFLAYAQEDGSLTLSEFFDNREYNEALGLEYQDYCRQEVVPIERERSVSRYDVNAQ